MLLCKSSAISCQQILLVWLHPSLAEQEGISKPFHVMMDLRQWLGKRECSTSWRLSSRSLQLRSGVDISLEGAVNDLGADVDHVGHDWLVLGSVPTNVSWLSVSVSVGCSMVLMENRGLSGSPLAVSVWNRWVLGQNLSQVPPEEIWVVNEGLGMDGMVVHDNGSSVSETSSETTGHEVDEPSVCEPASHIEVLDRKFSNEHETKDASQLSARCVVSPVEV